MESSSAARNGLKSCKYKAVAPALKESHRITTSANRSGTSEEANVNEGPIICVQFTGIISSNPQTNLVGRAHFTPGGNGG